MSDALSSPRLRRSIFVSVGINCAMVLTGAVGSLARPLRWLTWVARGLAMPPSLVLRYAARPSGHSIASYALTAMEGVFGSIVFYALAAWGAFWLYARLRSARTPPDAAQKF